MGSVLRGAQIQQVRHVLTGDLVGPSVNLIEFPNGKNLTRKPLVVTPPNRAMLDLDRFNPPRAADIGQAEREPLVLGNHSQATSSSNPVADLSGSVLQTS